MAFDPDSARPVGFDPSTAVPDPPRAPPEAYAGWDTPGMPAPKEKLKKPDPTSWDKQHPVIAYTNTFPEPFATAAGLGLYAAGSVADIAKSLGTGFLGLWNRMDALVNHPVPFQPIHGLPPDESSAFTTLMTLGAGDLPLAKLESRIDLTPKPDKAAKGVARVVGADMKAQGVTAGQAADELSAGRALGKPLWLADQGENAQALLGVVSRKPGEAKEAVKLRLGERDEAAYTRSQADIAAGLGSGPTSLQTHAGLKQNQILISQPLYDAAYEGGSIAPLEHQYTQAFDTASKASKAAADDLAHANNQLTVARAKLTQTTGNVYSENAARQEVRDAEMAINRAHRAMDAAEGDKQMVHDILRQTQQDGATGKPGAVWTPHIQRTLEDPIVRSGIARGIESQRLEALAKRTTIDPTEYTIVGTDEAGNPIVSKTPNMRTLDAVKRGMDGIIAKEHHPDGSLTQHGREVWLVREEFLKDVDGINPNYAKARAAWAGEAASDDALTTGKNFDKFTNPDDLADVVKGMSDTEKEFMRIGAANRLREKIGNLSVNGDEAKALLNTPFMKERMKAVFPSQEAAMDYIQKVDLERKMFETKLNTSANSASARRLADDVNYSLETGIMAAHTAGNAMMGHYLTAIRSAWRMSRAQGLRPNPALNKQIADVLMDPTAIPVMGPETTRLPPRTVAGWMLGDKNIRPGRLTIQRGQASSNLNQLGGPP